MATNVAIKEGWAGGPRLSAAFRQALTGQGFTITDDLNADAVIAHSTGCYDLRVKSPANLYILIGPPFWPGKSIVSRLFTKKKADSQTVRQTNGLKAVLVKTFWEFFYVITKPGYTFLALKHNGSLAFLDELKGKRVIVIRNQNDYYCSSKIQLALNAYPNVLYINLPGEHDDYYVNPKPYIDLLSKIYT